MKTVDDKLKILLISPLPPPVGGIAAWTKLFLSSKQANQHVIDVVNTTLIGRRVNNIWKRDLLTEIKRTILIYGQIKNKLKTKYDIAHINCACSKFGMLRDYLCLMVAKKSNIKVVVHYHCDTDYMIKGNISKFIFKKICTEANQIFCLNQSSETHIKQISNKIPKKIPNFIEIEKINNKPRKFSPKLKEIIFAGHVVRSKGCMDIIAVANKLSHLNFKILGKESEEFKTIPKPDNIQCLGEVSKETVIQQMLDSDLFLFPSYTEGFPNVILEAMASGLPIISTPVGAIPEILEDQGGRIVGVGDIEGIVNAIKELEEPGIRREISLWNKEKVVNAYSFDLVIAHIFKEYSFIKQQVN